MLSEFCDFVGLFGEFGDVVANKGEETDSYLNIGVLLGGHQGGGFEESN